MDGITPELCARCGFDSRRWRRRDVKALHGSLGYWWRLATGGVSGADLNRRPAPGVWSALEYGLHTATAAAVLRQDIEAMHRHDGVRLAEVGVLGSIDSHDHVELDPGAVLADVQREGDALAVVAGRHGAAWHHRGVWPEGRVVQAEAVLVHAAHDTSHHFMDVGEGLAGIGAGVAAGRGTVAQVKVSDGGVPKGAVREAAIGWDGGEGDRQADTKHHGRPGQVRAGDAVVVQP